MSLPQEHLLRILNPLNRVFFTIEDQTFTLLAGEEEPYRATKYSTILLQVKMLFSLHKGYTNP
jgi:hypothetical protein